MNKYRFLLFPRFSSVIVFAKHLAVVSRSFSSQMPRCDVVAFHFADVVMFRANRANSFLSFVGFSFLVVGKSPYAQKSFFACQRVVTVAVNNLVFEMLHVILQLSFDVRKLGVKLVFFVAFRLL